MSYKGFIFDLDGTLLNSMPVCYIGFRKTLLRFLGREFSDDEIKGLFGPTEEGVFKKILPDNWQDCLSYYLEQYNLAHLDYAEPFPGIVRALELLTKRNMRLAIVSGKGPGSMEISLKHSNLGGFFEMVITGSEHGANKPNDLRQVLRKWDYAPGEVAYVGDMPYDVSAANEVGIDSIAAVWANTSDIRKIEAMNPTRIFTDVESFIEWIKRSNE
jgi:pyrophosphatase PpaX